MKYTPLSFKPYVENFNAIALTPPPFRFDSFDIEATLLYDTNVKPSSINKKRATHRAALLNSVYANDYR